MNAPTRHEPQDEFSFVDGTPWFGFFLFKFSPNLERPVIFVGRDIVAVMVMILSVRWGERGITLAVGKNSCVGILARACGYNHDRRFQFCMPAMRVTVQACSHACGSQRSKPSNSLHSL